MKYSVIIPIYNMEKYLNECIESVVSQNSSDMEIILVNDGSTDSSLEICKKFKEKYNNVIIINKENTGTSDSILKGINGARGKYICFIDSDDKITENYFEVLNNYIDKDYDIIMFNYKKMYKNGYKNMDIDKVPYGVLEEGIVQNLQTNLFENFERFSFYRWNKVVKTSVLRKNIENIKDKTIYLEDHVISFLNLLNAKKILHIKDCLYLYRMRKNSVSRSVNEKIFDDLQKVKSKMIDISKDIGGGVRQQ